MTYYAAMLKLTKLGFLEYHNFWFRAHDRCFARINYVAHNRYTIHYATE